MTESDDKARLLERLGAENENLRGDPGAVRTRLETLRERIQERLLVTGLSARAASIKAGLGADAIRIIMDGRSTRPGFDRLEALAEVLQCDVQYLLGWTDDPRPFRAAPRRSMLQLPVRDTVAAGRWRESTVLASPSGRRIAPEIDALRGHDQWIEKIEDNSLDQLVPKGALVRIVALRDLGYSLRKGDIVLVERTRSNHALRERTLRVVAVADGYRYLELASSDPEIGQRLTLPDGTLSWPADVSGGRYMDDAEWDSAYERYAKLARAANREVIPKSARTPEFEFFGNVHVTGLAVSAEIVLSAFE